MGGFEPPSKINFLQVSTSVATVYSLAMMPVAAFSRVASDYPLALRRKLSFVRFKVFASSPL